MDAVKLLEPVDELGGRWPVDALGERWRFGAEPSAEVGEGPRDRCESDPDQGQSCRQPDHGPSLGFRWRFQVH